MKRFLLNVTVFWGIICVLVIIVVCGIMPQIKLYTNPFNGWYSRCMLVHKSCDKPRLILVGGSNLACGIDTALLSTKLRERYKIVNLGFHAGLGVGVHLDLIDAGLRPGDVVVLMVEYSNWSRWNGALPAIVFRCDVMGRNLLTCMLDSKWCTVDLAQWHHYVMEKFNRLVGGAQLFAEPNGGAGNQRVVSNEATDDAHPDPYYASQPVYATGRFKLDELSMTMLQDLKSSYSDRGVRLFLSAPSYDVRHYALHASEIEHIYMQIESCAKIRRISNPKDYAFPLSEMGNTQWHLNRSGRKKMTETLARDILRMED